MLQNIRPITMTAQEAANYLGISYWLILEMTKKHQIPFIACGARKLFRKTALDNWMDDQEKQSTKKTDDNMNNQYGKLRKIY